MALPRTFFALLFLLITLTNPSMGARMLDLWKPDAQLLTYHQGAVLQGSIPVSVLWYGTFLSSQKSIILDFIQSLASSQQQTPSVSQWMDMIYNFYLSKVGNGARPQVLLVNQVDDAYSLGKSLSADQISQLAAKAQPQNGGIALVLTADDVMVDDFCSTRCGMHGSNPTYSWTFIWVGNSATQCPGHCAWPFNQPVNGPQGNPLKAPNGDIGCEGMVINIGIMFASTVTNPYGNGYYQGQQDAPLEAATACPGYYGQGAFPGYAGQLLMDPASGASYNAYGANGRKYLVPAMMNPDTSMCSPLQ
ncbi:Protein EXORDIUM [Rhynchospora pubera]|uniref:Protein EXORDIUM n=1 Tax=Rhynchospora pubera TaxID=906938 RepID=A0AAV8D512_9POAL|nr:Protein EXORDIUM [Rhynchospora pubera]